MTLSASLMSSEKDDWNTPNCVLFGVREVLGIIGLDPCHNEKSIVDAHCTIDKHQDGLKTAWWDVISSNGSAKTAFVNPPYGGKATLEWAAKIVKEADLGLEIIALVPARTDTRAFQNYYLAKGDALCFWKGRLTFIGAPAPAPFPSAIVYFGHAIGAFRNAFEHFGHVMDL